MKVTLPKLHEQADRLNKLLSTDAYFIHAANGTYSLYKNAASSGADKIFGPTFGKDLSRQIDAFITGVKYGSDNPITDPKPVTKYRYILYRGIDIGPRRMYMDYMVDDKAMEGLIAVTPYTGYHVEEYVPGIGWTHFAGVHTENYSEKHGWTTYFEEG